MPIFCYRCPTGHITEALVKSDERDAPKMCVHEFNTTEKVAYALVSYCGKPLERVMTAPAAFPGADSWRK